MTPEEQAAKWVETRFPEHKRPKFGDGDFTESDVEEAFSAGFAAAKYAVVPVGEDLAELIEQLKDGCVRCGEAEDGSIELFDIEGANEIMFDAALAIAALVATQPAPISAVSARLSAAAPDLLAICKRILNHPIIRITGDVEVPLQAAISKAEGRAS